TIEASVVEGISIAEILEVATVEAGARSPSPVHTKVASWVTVFVRHVHFWWL
ncbi:hypothetical protein AWRI1631_47470, partial [Saccharomyces cerevisiae AWRI1631]